MRTLFFMILLASISFAQDFGITSKLNTNLNSSYNSYLELSIAGNISFSNTIEASAIIGLNSSQLANNIFDDNVISQYANIDYIDISKSIIGISLNYYPITFASTYTPFVGIKGSALFDNKSLLFFNKNGGGMIWDEGYYNFKSKEDMAFTLLSGLKIKWKQFNIIIELEFQKRFFILEYEEYDNIPNFVATRSINKNISSLNFGIGLQFVF